MVCFRNRNHFSAFLAIIAPAALCLTLREFRRNLWSFFPHAAMFLSVTAGVILSCSRGGWAACLSGMLACAAGLLSVKRIATAAAVLLTGCAAAAVLLGVPAPQLQERLATLQNARETDSYRTRVQCWKDSAGILLSHPVTGAGPNGFRMVYPAHRTASRSSFMTHAENEYVQTAVDGGLVGVIFAAWLVLSVAARVRSSLRGDESWHVHAIAVLAALAAAAVSAGVDFALHIPLYAVTLAAFAGLAFTETDRSGGARTAFLPILAILAAVIGGTWSFRTEEIDDPRVIHGAGSSEVARALVWAPTFQYAWHGLGRAAWATGARPAVEFGERCISAAVERDPNNYVLWKELGLIRMSLGDAQGAREAFARVRTLRSWVPVPDLPEAAR
jgi:O-antigen ligase